MSRFPSESHWPETPREHSLQFMWPNSVKCGLFHPYVSTKHVCLLDRTIKTEPILPRIKTFLAYLFISIFSNFFRLSTLVKLQSSFSISQLSLWSLLRIEHLWAEIMPCPNRSHSASLWIPSSSQTTTNYAFGGPWQLVKSEISTLTTGIVDLKQLAKC